MMKMKKWYDGYDLKGISIYNPRSVVMSITGHDFDNYWTQTETYESVRTYIEMNYDGLRDTIVELIAGERKRIDTTTFTNDMVTFEIKDDVLTLLIHLGYLGYDFDSKEIFIPNYEIREQFISTVRAIGWNDVVRSLQVSEELLKATIEMNETKVAEIVDWFIRRTHLFYSIIMRIRFPVFYLLLIIQQNVTMICIEN